jgi:hypothetical protein
MKRKPRTVSDWIGLAVFVAVAAGAVYFVGWVLSA